MNEAVAKSTRAIFGGFSSMIKLQSGSNAELLIAPQDLRTADPTRATDILSGRFVLAGRVLETRGQSVFQEIPPSHQWLEALHSFEWFRHLRVNESEISRVQARALIEDWIRYKGHEPAVRNQPSITARRIISWLCHSPLLLEGCEHDFYQSFMRSLFKQISALRSFHDRSDYAEERFLTAMALAYAAISMSGPAKRFDAASERLDKALNKQFLADGGHVTRNPAFAITAMTYLLPLRQAIIARNTAPSGALISAIDRIMPFLRMMRLGDGTFAQFNGMGDTPADLVATLVAYDESSAVTPTSAPNTGYERLEAGETILLMDTGPAPIGRLGSKVNAGCLSFEFSSGTHKIVSNCGQPPERSNPEQNYMWAKLARTTAAHSTLTIAEESSCQFVTNSKMDRWLGAPILAGPANVTSEHAFNERGLHIEASHDGYLSDFGYIHHRTISLSEDGYVLTGKDHLEAQAKKSSEGLPIHIRFHMATGIQLFSESDPSMLQLELANGERWIFAAPGQTPSVEESIILSPAAGVRQSMQIVLTGESADQVQFNWSFQRIF